MHKTTKKLSDEILDRVSSFIKENQFGFSEEKLTHTIAKKIETNKKYRIRDFDDLISIFAQEELDLLKSSDKPEEDKQFYSLVYTNARKVLEHTKKIRRAKTRNTSKIDTNLLTHAPFFVGGSKKRKEQGKREGHIELDKNGIKKVTYENSSGVLLSTKDARTLVALFTIWEEQGFNKTLSFTEYQVIDKLNMNIGGKQYLLVRESLEKLRSTNIILQEAFVLSEGRKIVTESFPLIISNKFITEEYDSGKIRSTQYNIEFSPYIHKSFNDGYCTLVSLAIFDELESDAAQSIYLLISGLHNMEENEKYKLEDGSYELPLKTLYEHLFLEDLNRKNRMTVEKACEDLKRTDIIESYHFTKIKNAYHSVVITPSEWLVDILTNKRRLPGVEEAEQLTLQM